MPDKPINMKRIILACALLCGVSLLLRAQSGRFLPNDDDSCNQWVNSTLLRLTLKQRIGQLMLLAVDPADNAKNRKALSQAIKKVGPGGFLFTHGTVEAQAGLTNFAQSLSALPALIAFDGEWEMTSLGCVDDNNLIRMHGEETARKLREMGAQVNIASVDNIATDKVLAYSKGVESGEILSVLKHFPGRGNIKSYLDTSIPIIPYHRAYLDSVIFPPFVQAIRQEVGGLMVGHLKFPALEPIRSVAASFSPGIINGLLKDELAFRGLVISEALYKKTVADVQGIGLKALKAGNDMILVNGNLENIQKEILQAIKSGEMTTKEIEEKCRKVLTYKYLLGLKSRPAPVSLAALNARINTPEAQELDIRLRAASITVLGNYGNVLPLEPTCNIAVVSIGEEDKDSDFLATLEKYNAVSKYRITDDTDAAEQRRISSELNAYNRVIISVTTDDLRLGEYLDFLSGIRTNAPLVYAFFTSYREMMPALAPLSKASAIVLAHHAHDDLQTQVAHILFGQATANGKLSVPIGRLFETGSGIELATGSITADVPEDYGMKSYILHRGIDSIANASLRAGTFPGCQILILKDGKPMYNKTFGVHSDADPTPTRPTDLFDLADLSQTTGTLLAVMRLCDTGKLKLTDKASQHVPALRTGNHRNSTIRELLMHESGLAPNVRYHRETINENSFYGPFTQGWADDIHATRIGQYTWACSTFTFKKGLISDKQTSTHRLHVADGMWLANSFRNEIAKAINNAPRDSKRYVYSPSGFIILQWVVEAIAKMPLDEYLETEFFAPMGLTRTKYLPLRYFAKEEIMPTARNDYFRRQDICGYVLDEPAACQGGVSGNAGLFSTAHEVAQVHQMILNGGQLDGKRYISEATCQLFATAQSAISRRGLGFDKPAPFDPSAPLANPCSPGTPLEAYGLSATTGCCAWVDPTNNIVYVFLSNRNCPDVWNDKIIQSKTLQHIQELIYQSLYTND